MANSDHSKKSLEKWSIFRLSKIHETKIFLDKAKDLVEFLLPRFTSEGKSYVGIAIGCTGGKHRSVVMTEEIGNWLKNDGKDAVIIHRDMKEA